jgi:hypothetical protein
MLTDKHGEDGVSRYVTFDGASAVEVFGKAQAWLARRDGAIGVMSVSWNTYSEDTSFGLTIYYEPE